MIIMLYVFLINLFCTGKSYPECFSGVSVDYDIQLEKEVDGIYSLQYSFDGKLLAVGCGNGTIRVGPLSFLITAQNCQF